MRRALERFRLWPLLGVSILGILLRLWQFGQVPVSLYWDEMAMWNDALSITQTGRDLFDRSWFQPLFISYGDYKLPVYIWITAFFSFFTDNPLIGTRLGSFFAGILMIPTIYLFVTNIQSGLGKKNLHQHLPLTAAFILAVLPWSLHFSRVGYEGHLSAFLLLASLTSLSFILTSSKRTTWYILGSSILGSLSMYAYFSTRFVWPVAVVGFLFCFWKFAKPHWKALFFAFILWFLAFIPMYQADFYQASNQYRLSAENILNDPTRPVEINEYRQRAGNTRISRVIFNRPTFVVRELALNYLEYLDPRFLFIAGDPNLRHGNGMTGIMFSSFAPFFLLGLLALLRKNTKIFFWLCAWWIAAVLPAAVPRDVPHALRSLNALPLFVLILAFGWNEFLLWMKSLLPQTKHLGAMITFLAFVVVAAELVRYKVLDATLYARSSAEEWQDGYLQTAQYVSRIKDKYIFVYVDQFDDRFFLYYQPYSGMKYSEIQKLPSQDFKRFVFGNVFLRPIDDWKTLEHNSVVITKPDRLPEGWSVLETLKNTAGEEEFVVSETPRR